MKTKAAQNFEMAGGIHFQTPVVLSFVPGLNVGKPMALPTLVQLTKGIAPHPEKHPTNRKAYMRLQQQLTGSIGWRPFRRDRVEAHFGRYPEDWGRITIMIGCCRPAGGGPTDLLQIAIRQQVDQLVDLSSARSRYSADPFWKGYRAAQYNCVTVIRR